MDASGAPVPHAASVVPWQVLVLLGPSGTGKSTAAQRIAHESSCTWLQVDDLRLAIQASRFLSDRRADETLMFFEKATDVWMQPIDRLARALVDIARLMAPAVRITIDSHVATRVPMVIEGDGILPELALDPVLRPHIACGIVRCCCVLPDTRRELLDNMQARGRGFDRFSERERNRQAQMNVAFGEWLAAECERLAIPVVRSRPLATLVPRILADIERP